MDIHITKHTTEYYTIEADTVEKAWEIFLAQKPDPEYIKEWQNIVEIIDKKTGENKEIQELR